MEQTSTQNKLILYAYDELPPEEMKAFRAQIEADSQLQIELENIEQLQGRLSEFTASPHPTNVQIVIEDSLNSQLEMH